MTEPRHALVVVVMTVMVAGCPAPSGNPEVLWLQPSNGEQNVKLGGDEPNPY